MVLHNVSTGEPLFTSLPDEQPPLFYNFILGMGGGGGSGRANFLCKYPIMCDHLSDVPSEPSVCQIYHDQHFLILPKLSRYCRHNSEVYLNFTNSKNRSFSPNLCLFETLKSKHNKTCWLNVKCRRK